MKKIFVVFLLLLSTFSLFALDGIVIDVLGKVEKQSGSSWVPLKKGDILQPGDIVSTGFRSEAVLSIGKSTVTVRALTRMTIEQLYEKNENHVSSVYLDVGSISADVKPVENKRVGFTVKTPAVTASVRGTAGIVYAYGKVEAIRGKWGLSAPRPKQIDFNRGDMGKPEQSDSAKVETSTPVVTETTVTTSETTEVNEDVKKEESATQESVTQEAEHVASPVPEGTPMIDGELESMLQGETGAVKEVYVLAGEVAQVKPGSTTVVAPQEVKKEEAAKLGEEVSVSATEMQASGNSTFVSGTSSIIIEIVIPSDKQ